MRIEEKRRALAEYCAERSCDYCVLDSAAFGCDNGPGFALGIPDEKVEMAYKVVFNDDKPTIKDSGERTRFVTGAVRDMHTGKGRMDLLPWNAIREVSKHCENGAIKYGEHNVDRGIPAHSLVDSGLRHLCKYICGETDEDHLLAAAWNIMWLLEMRTTHPELMDIPWRPDA